MAQVAVGEYIRGAARLKTIIVAGAVALLIALLGTPLLIGLMRRHGYGQPIRVEGPKSHETKRGTPTMGGAVFVIAALIGYVVAHAATDDPFTPSGLLVLLLMAGLGVVGFIDDFFKIHGEAASPTVTSAVADVTGVQPASFSSFLHALPLAATV